MVTSCCLNNSKAFERKDVKLPKKSIESVLYTKHTTFITQYGKETDYFEYHVAQSIRMSGIYWSLTALDLMGNLEKIPRQEVLDFLRTCFHTSGGFSPYPNHGAHLLSTLSAIQILLIYDALDLFDVEAIGAFISGLQCDDGSFSGDKWGEADTRITFCGVASLSLIGRLDLINRASTVKYILSCCNFDGGFGSLPGSESHAGQIYCCLGTLAILRALNHVDVNSLASWLQARQLPSGGLNGRPEKMPDICYSWWVLASLSIIGRIEWIYKDSLRNFIFASQEENFGGIADIPGDIPDPYHTLFGLAGLSLLGDDNLKDINPIYCLPQYIVDKNNISCYYFPK